MRLDPGVSIRSEEGVVRKPSPAAPGIAPTGPLGTPTSTHRPNRFTLLHGPGCRLPQLDCLDHWVPPPQPHRQTGI